MKKNRIFDFVLLILSLILCLGTKFVFHACAPKEDGGWMACHWAEQSVFGIGIALTVMSVILIILKDRKIKSGIALGMIPVSLISAIIPKNMINLCMMTDMRCHSVMHPAVMIVSIMTAAASAVYMFISVKSGDEK